MTSLLSWDVVRTIVLVGLVATLGHQLYQDVSARRGGKRRPPPPTTPAADSTTGNSRAEGDAHECASCGKSLDTPTPCAHASLALPVSILYASQTATCKNLAHQLQATIRTQFSESAALVDVIDLATRDPDDILPQLATPSLVLFVLPTYEAGHAPCESFLRWLDDARFDFRVSRLHSRGFAVFAVGDDAYDDKEFCRTGRQVDAWMQAMGARRSYPLGIGNIAAGAFAASFAAWSEGIVEVLRDPALDVSPPKPDSAEAAANGEHASGDEDNATADADAGLVDLEDMGNVAQKLQLAKKERDAPVVIRDMLTPQMHKTLTKQGYKIVGTHSGVKLCRWTKAALRGRGFCYKYAFYGIQSHRCMETTPSLACANKCVFCWRHHSNPIGTSWRWTMDDPEFILEGAMEKHYRMINEFKGVPGVRADRYQEAFKIRHCALSLVGEPIMYPKINEFITMLHAEKISSFLVTNAQFPEQIRDLVPVTQLYVSVDASTKDSLKKVDRPLFSDYWERFLGCMDAIREKSQRTVYRLTLVKEFNTEEVSQYADLINRGMPDFVEIKGVTFCGYSGASPLTMANVPFHVEVARFAEVLVQYLSPDAYAIACEHAHSCSILIARTRFRRNDGTWCTWIDYDKFQELVASGRRDFDAMDYCVETPSWSIYGSEERGFAPSDTRWYRNKPGKTGGKAVEAGGDD